MGSATSVLNQPSPKQRHPTSSTYAMMGLSGAGKTTILCRLKFGLFTSASPSSSVNVETIDYHYSNSRNTNSSRDNNRTTRSIGRDENTRYFELWDVTEGGGRALTEYERWRSNHGECLRGIIFVIDSSDLYPLSMSRASERLREILQEESLLGSGIEHPLPLLVLANKQDYPHAMTVAEVKDLLALEGLPEKQMWHIQGISVILDEGLREGVEWLLNNS